MGLTQTGGIAPRQIQTGQMLPELRPGGGPAVPDDGVGGGGVHVGGLILSSAVILPIGGDDQGVCLGERPPFPFRLSQSAAHQIPVVCAHQRLDTLTEPFAPASQLIERWWGRLRIERRQRRSGATRHRLGTGSHGDRFQQLAVFWPAGAKLLERSQGDVLVITLYRNRHQLVAVIQPSERGAANRRVRRPPGHRAYRLLDIDPPERRPADRLEPGRPCHLAEIASLGQTRQSNGGTLRVGIVHRHLPEPRDRLGPHTHVPVGLNDPPQRLRVRQPHNGRRAYAGVGILGRDRRQQILGVVLEIVHRGCPNRWVVMLPLGLATESIEQAHVIGSASSAIARHRAVGTSVLDSATVNYAYSGPTSADGLSHREIGVRRPAALAWNR